MPMPRYDCGLCIRLFLADWGRFLLQVIDQCLGSVNSQPCIDSRVVHHVAQEYQRIRIAA